jgi:hypothetical protein
MGIISDSKSNIVLGSIENKGRPTSEYTLYREPDLEVTNPLNCFTPDDVVTNNSNVQSTPVSPSGRLNSVGAPVDMYFECDNRFYQDKGSSTNNVINYLLGFFNNTALLYSNESIQIQVSQVLVWTTQDPEAAAGLTTTSAVLNAFSNRMSTATYIGDYAHFLSTRSLGGGIAWLTGTCPTKFNRAAVSAIFNTYSNFPLYSWTVEVVTHEIGHNLGSHHTHWCGWPGGPIDGCGPTANAAYAEGTCTTGPLPSGTGGTIMSYCHLLGAVGINFNNGFGPLPGQAIRDFVTASPCIATCQMTISFTKQDASCGQNNGTATVTAANSTGALTYVWSNGQTGPTLINGAPNTTYFVTVTDAAGCQVIDDVTIGNSGTALTFGLTPNGAAGFCTGGSLVLTATNNAAYTYQWKQNGTLIGAATSNTYTAISAATYAVTVTSGACSGTQSVIVSEVAAPTASVSAGGATTFCEGSNVILNADIGSAYGYQWFNNGTQISGATAATYSATATGNYTVKVSAGVSCAATSSAVAVTVNTSPLANVTATGLTTFCSGSSVLLTASSGTGYTYQWYKTGILISGAVQNTYTATTAGSYTVIVTLATCSRTSSATTATVLPTPVVIVTPALSTIQKFQSQTLTGSGASSYNWSSLPDMVSNTTSSAVYRPLTTKNYPVEGTAANGCKGIGNATITVIGCGDVTDITSTINSPSRVNIHWTNPPDVTTDTLQYRKTGEPTWHRVFVTGQDYELNGLEPGTDYEYNIIPLCTTTTVFIPSPVKTFKTPALENGIYIRLFPNPVSGNSRLEIISAAGFTLSASIYDNTGKLVRVISGTENFPAGQIIKTVGAEKLANGVYHIALRINGKVQDIKMMVVR